MPPLDSPVSRTLWLIIALVVATAVGRVASGLLVRGFASTRRLLRRRYATRQPPMLWSPGELPSVRRAPFSFGLVKILAADHDTVHIRLYKHTFPVRPQLGSASLLTLESLNDSAEFGIGHLPLAHDTFRPWEPLLPRFHTLSARHFARSPLCLTEHASPL